jgi:hypothetical protein
MAASDSCQQPAVDKLTGLDSLQSWSSLGLPLLAWVLDLTPIFWTVEN